MRTVARARAWKDLLGILGEEKAAFLCREQTRKPPGYVFQRACVDESDEHAANDSRCAVRAASSRACRPGAGREQMTRRTQHPPTDSFSPAAPRLALRLPLPLPSRACGGAPPAAGAGQQRSSQLPPSNPCGGAAAPAAAPSASACCARHRLLVGLSTLPLHRPGRTLRLPPSFSSARPPPPCRVASSCGLVPWSPHPAADTPSVAALAPKSSPVPQERQRQPEASAPKTGRMLASQQPLWTVAPRRPGPANAACNVFCPSPRCVTPEPTHKAPLRRLPSPPQ